MTQPDLQGVDACQSIYEEIRNTDTPARLINALPATEATEANSLREE